MKFEKPALTVEEMIINLKNHGMLISDENLATKALSRINYYRLSTYWFPYKEEMGEGKYRFLENLEFETILYHYDFDGQLRNLVTQGIEIIEIALRRSIAANLAIKIGPFAFQDSQNFSDYKKWSRSSRKLLNEYHDSKEEFASHYRVKYSEHMFPPIWVSLELTTFGTLSYMFSNIKENRIRNAIAREFQIDEIVLVSFLHHLTYVRNLCAHHSRLWNRRFVITMKFPKNLPEEYLRHQNPYPVGRKQIFNSLVVMDFVISQIDPDFKFMSKVGELLNEFSDINTIYMGKLP